MISTPQTGVDSMFVTYSLLGLPVTIIRPVVASISGISGGMVTKKIVPENYNATIRNNENEDEMP